MSLGERIDPRTDRNPCAMNLRPTSLASLGLASLLLHASPAAAQCSRQADLELISSAPAVSGNLGWSVALDGDVLVAGARNEGNPIGAAFDGAATIWRKAGGVWNEEQRLLRPSALTYGHYGAAVAVSGAVVAIANEPALTSSRVVLHRFDGVQWNEEDTLAPAPGTNGGFANSLALDGDTLLVGCNTAAPSVGAPASGTVGVFRYNGASWAAEAVLAPPTPSAGHFFGWSVALDGDVALVGSRASVGSTAYVFRRSGSTWSFEAELPPQASGAGSFYGHSCAIAGDVAVVGALNDIAGAVNAGLVTVWRRIAGVWTFEQELRPTDGFTNLRFGTAVALDGTRLAVAAYFDGSGYVYERRNGAWRFLSKLEDDALNGAGVTNSRGAIALSNGVAALGAPGHSAQLSLSGVVSVFDVAAIGTVCAYCSPKTDSVGCTPSIQFAGQPSASATNGFTISAAPVANQRLGMLMFSLAGGQELAFSGGLNCIRSPQRTTSPQNSGGSTGAANDCSGAFALDFNAWRAAGPHPLMVAGRQVFAQYWYRDNGASTGLSTAIQFLLEP